MMLKNSLIPLAMAVCLASAVPAAAQAFPDGPGKEILEKKCSTCHAPEQVTTFGRSAEEWHEVVVNMIDLGAEVNEEEAKVLIEYLTKNWPVKGSKPAEEKPADKPAEQPAPAPAPQAAPGAMAPVSSHAPSVTIREWDVPTPKSRPHDPLAASDGTIWYTGQMVNVLGRLDPKTGQIKEFPLKTPASGPHGLAEDKAGNIWYTGNSKALIGKLDPKTGQVTEYPMPDPAAKDPHSLAFDQKGTLWFTVQGANMVGRLNPVSGELALRNSPTTKSLPYGIMINSKGVPFFVEFGANKIASIDPSTMIIREWTLPDANARPRRLAIDAQDNVWYSDYARGFLGKLDPATSQVKEWASPGGPKSQPYGIAVIDGKVWYSEAGVQPNTIVMFDPSTEKFQTWPIPSGGGVVRNVSVTKDGNLALALSGVNKIGLVEIKK
jgi:virginiamycin B lyase